MKNWFLEVYYTNPFAYAFQAGMANEFHDRTFPCVGRNLIPSGPGYEDVPAENQACAGVGGALPGANFVTGDQYLGFLHYKHSQLWRNFGIIWAWWGFFAVLTVIFTSFWKATGNGGASLLIPREKLKAHNAAICDEEAQRNEKAHTRETPDAPAEADDSTLTRNTSIFTWRNLTYTVSTPNVNHELSWVSLGRALGTVLTKVFLNAARVVTDITKVDSLSTSCEEKESIELSEQLGRRLVNCNLESDLLAI